MSNKPQTPALHIARKHQSAPKAHWAEKPIKEAAEEIATGRYVPDTSAQGALNSLGLALSAGTAQGVATGNRPSLAEMQFTRDINELGQHPRVIEAMERMKREVEETTNPQEAIEKAWMLREMTAQQAAGQKWDGQERWEGAENEEMRHGQLLTPADFYMKLVKVIGIDRVLLSGNVVKTHPEAKSGRVGLYVKNPLYTGASQIKKEYVQVKAQEIRHEGEAKLKKAKQLRAAGQDAAADRMFNDAGDAAKTAAEMLMEMSAEEQTAEPEYLRVGTLQWPLGTEWMIMDFDEFGVPTKARFLGWRTALLTIVRTRAITEDEANKAFPVGLGPASSWYREQLYMLRNQGGPVN